MEADSPSGSYAIQRPRALGAWGDLRGDRALGNGGLEGQQIPQSIARREREWAGCASGLDEPELAAIIGPPRANHAAASCRATHDRIVINGWS
jgi:hypothetical protein